MKASLADTVRMSLALARSALVQPRPFLFYLKPTARCDLRCAICNRWQETSSSEEELSLDEIRSVLAKFHAAGAQILTLWGGEPTLRRDLPEILAEAKRLGMRTSMCTNCNSLAKKADAILPNLDTLLCSLDGYGETHDAQRGVPGLFERVLAALAAAQRFPHLRLKIWATVHTRNAGQQEKLAQLAKDHGAWIEFFPVSPIPGYNNETVPSDSLLAEVFDEVARLKRAGYPIWNADRVIDKMARNAPFKCNFGRAAIHMDHKGTLYSCEDPAGTPIHVWGPHADFDPTRLYASPEFKAVSKRLESCGRCRLPCVVELADNLTADLADMFLQSVTR
jgi:MoaA/NifB/PqqE/SkfB family radical SAM enzyme